MAQKMESLRLRLVFKNGDILSKTQKSQGLKKSWILLHESQTQLKSIAALSDYIIQVFHLHQSCPHGILLFMDEFVLPPFESTSILRDKDIISVKKKEGVLAIEGNDAADKIEEMQIVEKQPVTTGTLLLANEEFDKESGGYRSEESSDESAEENEANNLETAEYVEDGNEILKKRKTSKKLQAKENEDNNLETTEYLEDGNEIPKKRKASKKLHGSKKKKQRLEPLESVANKVHTEPTENPPTDGVPSKKKSTGKKGKLSKREIQTNAETNAKSAEANDGHVDSTHNLKRNEQVQENGNEVDDATNVSESTRKGPSRSSRRKYAKRRYLREMQKIQNSNEGSQSKEVMKSMAGKKEVLGQPKGLLHWNQFGRYDMSATSSIPAEENQNCNNHGNSNKNSDMTKEVVPIMIRPGHIRFEPLEEVDADEAVQQSQVSMETFQWNGITSKKKGQKWGRDKSSVSRRNDYQESEEENAAMNIEEDIRANEQLDFDKLPPLPRVPKDGDLIAYRLLELSSSWTPEISSFRVGKVSRYDSQSSKIMLMPVPEYPVVSRNTDEGESTQQQDNTLYNEDGSLETDFTSLLDVRIIRNGGLDPSTSKGILHEANEGPVHNETSMLLSSNDKSTKAASQGNVGPKQGNGDPNQGKPAKAGNGSQNQGKPVHASQAPTTETGENLWEQFSEALNAKKTELSKENGWSKGNSGKSPWSYRALKGSALGPTMAFLRSETKEKK